MSSLYRDFDFLPLSKNRKFVLVEIAVAVSDILVKFGYCLSESEDWYFAWGVGGNIMDFYLTLYSAEVQ